MKPTTSAIAMPDKKNKEKKQIEINKQNKVSAKTTTRVVGLKLLKIELVLLLLLMLLLFYDVIVARSTSSVNRVETRLLHLNKGNKSRPGKGFRKRAL